MPFINILRHGCQAKKKKQLRFNGGNIERHRAKRDEMQSPTSLEFFARKFLKKIKLVLGLWMKY